MAYQDQLEKQRQDAKNAVEEYVYNMRDKLEYGLREFISDDDRTKFLELLNATEEWLYDEGEDQPKKVRYGSSCEDASSAEPCTQVSRGMSLVNRLNLVEVTSVFMISTSLNVVISIVYFDDVMMISSFMM